MAQKIILKKPSKVSLIRWTLDILYFSQIYHLFKPGFNGVGAIFTLHHIVKSNNENPFSPNRILEVTTDFLEQTILQVQSLGYDIVSLDEALRRLIEKDFRQKFVCFTLDDGYVDNYELAFPIFKKHNVEFTIYVATGLPDGTAFLWWQALEKLILKEDLIELVLADELLSFSTVSTLEKYKAYYHIYWALRNLPIEEQYSTAQNLFDTYGINTLNLCKKSAISWDELGEISQNNLATIGAHTVNHFPLSKLSIEKAHDEATISQEIIANQLGVKTKHFCYPYGDDTSASSREFKLIKELSFDTATTTRKGVLFPEHANYLHALPRISLNGDYQKQRYVKIFLSGAPFALSRYFRPINVN